MMMNPLKILVGTVELAEATAVWKCAAEASTHLVLTLLQTMLQTNMQMRTRVLRTSAQAQPPTPDSGRLQRTADPKKRPAGQKKELEERTKSGRLHMAADPAMWMKMTMLPPTMTTMTMEKSQGKRLTCATPFCPHRTRFTHKAKENHPTPTKKPAKPSILF